SPPLRAGLEQGAGPQDGGVADPGHAPSSAANSPHARPARNPFRCRGRQPLRGRPRGPSVRPTLHRPGLHPDPRSVHRQLSNAVQVAHTSSGSGGRSTRAAPARAGRGSRGAPAPADHRMATTSFSLDVGWAVASWRTRLLVGAPGVYGRGVDLLGPFTQGSRCSRTLRTASGGWGPLSHSTATAVVGDPGHSDALAFRARCRPLVARLTLPAERADGNYCSQVGGRIAIVHCKLVTDAFDGLGESLAGSSGPDAIGELLLQLWHRSPGRPSALWRTV